MPGDEFVFGVEGRDRKRLVLLILLLTLLVLAEISPANAQPWLDSEFRNRHHRSQATSRHG